MDEKRFYDEKEETKQMPLICPHCRQEGTFPVRWMVRNKKVQIPAGANSEDRKQFEKARSYMVRIDNMVACRNIRCRKRFDLTGQTVFPDVASGSAHCLPIPHISRRLNNSRCHVTTEHKEDVAVSASKGLSSGQSDRCHGHPFAG